MLRNLQSLFLIVVLLFASNCRKKSAAPGRPAQQASGEPLANAFVVKSAIAMFATPEDRAKAIATLPIGSRLEIFESRIPDKRIPDKAFWYRVKYAPLTADATTPQTPVEGYVSEREEVLRDNLMVFEKKTEFQATRETEPGKFEDVKEPLAVIATTSLNLRKSPALNAAVIRTLKNGEVLEVREQSAKSVEIDSRRAHWYLLEDEKGEKGYAFGGYLLEGAKSAMLGLKDAGFRFASGWVVPTGKDARIYLGAAGAALLKITGDDYRLPAPWVESKGKLQSNAYVRVDGATTRGNPQRYRLMHRRQVEGDYYETDYYYVDKKAVKFVKDYFTVSKAQPHGIETELADEINKFVGGDLNLQCTKVVDFEGGPADNPRRFKAVLAATGASLVGVDPDSLCGSTQLHTVFSEMSGERAALYRSAVNGEFKDLDGDKIPEIVSRGGGRGYWTLEIYSIKPGKVTKIAALGNDMDSGSNEEKLNWGYASVLDSGVLEIGPPQYVCERSDGETAEQCAASIAAIKKRAGFLKFDKKREAFPFYGRLEGDKFVQIPKPPEVQ